MNKKTLVDQLGKLVTYKTLSDNRPENLKAINYIKTLLPTALKIEVVENKNAIILMAGTGLNIHKPEYGYLVHVDVVSGNEEQFSLKVDGDRIYGRGVSDMKFSIPIGIELLKSALRANIDMTLVVTTDEEVGGGTGAGYLAKNDLLIPKLLIVPDGGSNYMLINRSKGALHIWIESMGKPAHASTIWKGRNALHPLMKLGNSLLERYEENEKKENWGTTLNIGVVTGGLSTNQVCPEALMKIDIRYPETRNGRDIFREIKSVAQNIDSSLKVRLVVEGDPTYTDISNPYLTRYAKVAEDVLGKSIRTAADNGTSDARYFSKYKVPILMTKPIGGESHSDSEWLSIKSTLKYYNILEKFINSKVNI